MRATRVSDLARGVVRAELVGAFPAAVLNAAAGAAIELWDAESGGENTLRFCIFENRLAELKTLAERGGCELRILDRLAEIDADRARAKVTDWILELLHAK